MSVLPRLRVEGEEEEDLVNRCLLEPLLEEEEEEERSRADMELVRLPEGECGGA